MRFVLDASVAVAAARPGEPAHAAARRRISRVLRGIDDTVIPVLFSIEVGAALARVGEEPAAIRAYVDAFLRAADAIVPLGPRAASGARETAMRWRLRAADAVYVRLAARERIPLCTLDREVAARGSSACEVIAP